MAPTKGSSSIEDYVLKMKVVFNSLIITGQQISEDELILYILSGLGPEFESVVVNFTSKDSITLPEVQYMLQTHEMGLDSLNAATVVKSSNSAANLVQTQTPYVSNFQGYQSGFRGRRYRGGRGRSYSGGGRSHNQFNTFNKPLCQSWTYSLK